MSSAEVVRSGCEGNLISRGGLRSERTCTVTEGAEPGAVPGAPEGRVRFRRGG